MNNGTYTHLLRRATTVAILATAIAAPAAHANPGYTGDVVSRYLASHAAGSSDVIDRYLISHTPTSVQPSNPVSDILDSLQVNRNQQIATQNPVSDVADSLQVNSNQQVADQSPVSDMANSLAVRHNTGNLAAHTSLTANGAGSVSRSFSWRDAGIGASAAVALILLLTAAGLQLAHRRRSPLAY
jgi:hypothetical protein